MLNLVNFHIFLNWYSQWFIALPLPGSDPAPTGTAAVCPVCPRGPAAIDRGRSVLSKIHALSASTPLQQRTKYM